MTANEPVTTSPVPDYRTLRIVLRLAGRAPSVHNTQPWRWVFDGVRLHLHADPDRLLPAADPSGRQRVISCGATLHHARTAFAAHGWHTNTIRLPDPYRPDYLAVIEFRPWTTPPPGTTTRSRAIDQRYTDRLPMLEPAAFDGIAAALRRLVAPHELEFDVLEADLRPRLAAVSDTAAAVRHDDQMYQEELHWWAGHPDTPEGVPPAALVSDAEFARVDVGRAFPSAPHSMRRATLTDHARLAVISSYGDAPSQWLRAGEALSAVLLECTATGLASCALTHLTELPTGRRTVASLLPHSTVAQVIIRIGMAPDNEPPPAPTPRRPLVDILELRYS